MAKRRKRTSKDIPAKGRLADFAHNLWSRAVRDDWSNMCAVCGATDDLVTSGLQAHHLIPCQFTRFRYLLRNGICLCGFDHKLNPILAPHMNAEGWLTWLKVRHPELREWYEQNNPRRWEPFDVTKNWRFFVDVIESLRAHVEPDDFEKIVGVKFDRWLQERIA